MFEFKSVNYEDVLIAENRLKVESKFNPLRQIEIGTIRELPTAYEFASKIVSGYGYNPETEANVKQLLIVIALHCIYAHYTDTNHYPIFPTVDFLISFLQMQMVEEVYQDENDNKKMCIIPKNFIDALWHLCNFKHIPPEPFDVEMWVTKVPDTARGCGIKSNFAEGYLWKYTVSQDKIMHLYPAYTDMFRIYDYNDSYFFAPHPFLWKSFGMLASKKKSALIELVNLTVCTLMHYMYEHNECTFGYIQNEIKNFRIDIDNENEIYLEPVQKGRCFKFRLPFFFKK